MFNPRASRGHELVGVCLFVHLESAHLAAIALSLQHG